MATVQVAIHGTETLLMAKSPSRGIEEQRMARMACTHLVETQDQVNIKFRCSEH